MTFLSQWWDFLSGLLRDSFNSLRHLSAWKKVLFLAAVAGFLYVTLVIEIPQPAQWREWSRNSPWVVWVFFLAYILITQFPIPRTLMTLSSGLLYGPVVGAMIAIVATTLSAALSLIIVRFLLGEWITPRLDHPAVRTINARLRQRGWLPIISLRMVAGIPFSIMNYACALSPVRLLPFTFATLLGSAPGTIVTVALGDTFSGQGDSHIGLIVLGLAILGIIGVVVDSRLPVKSVG